VPERTGARREGFTVLGFRVIAGPGSLLGIGLLAWVFSANAPGPALERWLIAGGLAVLVYLSVLAHELGHAYAARALGYPVHSIALHVLGGWTRFARTRRSALREGVISAAGPAVTGVLAVIVWVLSTQARLLPGAQGWPLFLLVALLEVLVLLTVYNLLPGLPLDGGAILRCLVWGATGRERLGQRVAAGAGVVLAGGLLSLPLLLWWRTGSPASLWFTIVITLGGLWLLSGALGAWRDAAALPAHGAAAPPPAVIPAAEVRTGTPLSLALAQAAADPRGRPALLVTDSRGDVLGLADPAAMAAVPAERRPWVPIDAFLRRDLGMPSLSEAERRSRIVRDDAGTVCGLRIVQ